MRIVLEDAEIERLGQILTYVHYREQADYNARPEGERQGHVYLSVEHLWDILRANGWNGGTSPINTWMMVRHHADALGAAGHDVSELKDWLNAHGWNRPEDKKAGARRYTVTAEACGQITLEVWADSPEQAWYEAQRTHEEKWEWSSYDFDPDVPFAVIDEQGNTWTNPDDNEDAPAPGGAD